MPPRRIARAVCQLGLSNQLGYYRVTSVAVQGVSALCTPSAIDDFRSGDLDAFEVDRALFQYSRGAKDLWKFCNMTDIEWTAGLLSKGPSIDWWERGAPKR